MSAATECLIPALFWPRSTLYVLRAAMQPGMSPSHGSTWMHWSNGAAWNPTSTCETCSPGPSFSMTTTRSWPAFCWSSIHRSAGPCAANVHDGQGWRHWSVAGRHACAPGSRLGVLPAPPGRGAAGWSARIDAVASRAMATTVGQVAFASMQQIKPCESRRCCTPDGRSAAWKMKESDCTRSRRNVAAMTTDLAFDTALEQAKRVHTLRGAPLIDD